MSCIADYLRRVHAGERASARQHSSEAPEIRPAAEDEQSFAAWLFHLTMLCPSPLMQVLTAERRRK